MCQIYVCSSAYCTFVLLNLVYVINLLFIQFSKATSGCSQKRARHFKYCKKRQISISLPTENQMFIFFSHFQLTSSHRTSNWEFKTSRFLLFLISFQPNYTAKSYCYDNFHNSLNISRSLLFCRPSLSLVLIFISLLLPGRMFTSIAFEMLRPC